MRRLLILLTLAGATSASAQGPVPTGPFQRTPPTLERLPPIKLRTMVLPGHVTAAAPLQMEGIRDVPMLIQSRRVDAAKALEMTGIRP